MSSVLDHERIVIRKGPRTGLPIVVAVHSTLRGQAIGGCRVAAYPDWRDGFADALRLSAAMTGKCVLAGLPHGGGKTVVALPPGTSPTRRDLLHDVGDLIDELDGAYATGPDIGTGPDDMATIAERTRHAFCRPVEAGGSGGSSEHTAVGTVAALKALCSYRFGSADISRRSFAVLGLGRVGGQVARLLVDAGAEVIGGDVDGGRRTQTKGLIWKEPEDCFAAEVDVLVPAAKGGLLTAGSVAGLRCAAVAGPANNQLDAPDTADVLRERGILWAPDVVVSAGGIIHATAVELRHETPAQVATRIAAIGATLTSILTAADTAGITPAAEADRRVAQALTTGCE